MKFFWTVAYCILMALCLPLVLLNRVLGAAAGYCYQKMEGVR